MKTVLIASIIFIAAASAALAANNEPVITPGLFDSPPAFPVAHANQVPTVMRGPFDAPPAFPATNVYDWTGFYVGINAGDCKSIIDLDAEVPDGALDFRMPKQQLDCPQVARAAIDQGHLGSSEGMCAEEMWVEPDAGDPIGEEPRVLPSRHAVICTTPAFE